MKKHNGGAVCWQGGLGVRTRYDACSTRTRESDTWCDSAKRTVISRFIVEGEQRYSVHVAIDRFTGQVVDKQIKVVNE